ncbi:UNVERIFIED_CONTAM: hypothetical protein FKN15_020229 [Acipenser sinensis]
MLEDIAKEPYSLIVDESTDISANKQLCVVFRNSLPLSAVDFGIKFQLELSESKIEPQKAEDIKRRCRDYMFEFLKEIKQRLPPNIHQLESLAVLSPSVVLSSKKPQLANLSFLPLYNGDLGKLEQQWRALNNVHWEHTEDNQIEEFWVEVAKHTDAAGDKDFTELGRFALSLLALPFSNASVERAFSQMALIKTKLRNRMQEKLLENILRVRAYEANAA